MFTWNPCNNKTILQELEVMNSNPEYNRISEDKSYLTEADILKEHEDEIEKERYIVTSEGSPFATVDFTDFLNEKAHRCDTPPLGMGQMQSIT